MSDEAATEAASSSGGGGLKAKLPLLLGLVNSLAVLGAVGMLTYTRLLYKRPQITEESERAKIAEQATKPKAPSTAGFVPFDPLTINISPSPPRPKAADGTQTQLQGKLHYATIGFSLELNDIARKEEIDAIKPLITDQFLALVGRKQFHELTSVQGRYVLKTQLIEIVNGLATKRLQLTKDNGGANGDSPLVTNLFFSQFIVQ